MHGGVGLGGHEVRHPDRAGLADPAQVVAEQVDDHQVLGAGLGVRGERVPQPGVLLRPVAAGRGALDGLGLGDAVPGDPQKAFGGRAGHGQVAELQEGRVGRRVDAPEDPVVGQRVGRLGQFGRVGQTDLVARAGVQLALARLDVGEIGLAVAHQPGFGGVQIRLRRGCRGHGGRGRRHEAQLRHRAVEPVVGVPRALRGVLRQADRVGEAVLVVDRDQPVGEEPGGVRGVGPVTVRRAAVGLELVSEVADVSAGEVEGQLAGVHPAGRQLPLQIVEDAGPHLARGPPGPLDLTDTGLDVVPYELGQRTGAVAEEREAGLPLLDPRAVQPERPGRVGAHPGEGRLGVHGGRDPAGVQPVADGRGPPGARYERRGGAACSAGLPRTGLGQADPSTTCRREAPEVQEQPVAVLGEDRLGVELHAPQGPGAVPQSHQDAVLGPGGALEARRQRFPYGERVVANRGEVLRESAEQALARVPDSGEMAVPGLRCGHHPGALAGRDALVSEADAEDGDRGLGEHRGADAEVACLGGVSRSWGHHDVVEPPEVRKVVGRGIVEDHHRLLAVDLGNQLEQVVCVRVIIVDEQGLHPPTPFGRSQPCAARRLCRPRIACNGGYSHFLKKRCSRGMRIHVTMAVTARQRNKVRMRGLKSPR